MELVSIHAPTRGATVLIIGTLLMDLGFNPRTHTGCDKAAGVEDIPKTVFQSTHPHGVRRQL